MFNKYCSFIFILLFSFLQKNCFAQTRDFITIIPTFHSRQAIGSAEGPIQLQHQRYVLFVYSNAVAVYSESDFVNNSSNSIQQELALPSTGHDENGAEPGGRISTGIFSIQLWVQQEYISPKFIKDGDEEWFTINAEFGPNESRKVKALFWAQTSLEDIDLPPGSDTTLIPKGERGFLIDLAHSSIWNNIIESIDVVVVLKDGITIDMPNFDAEPQTYDIQDSTLTWNMHNIEPTGNDNINVFYSSTKSADSTNNTIKNLAAYIVKNVYNQLIIYAEQPED